jgi:predicted AAA+ superfamily ATPase
MEQDQPYRRRIVDDELDGLMRSLPAIAVEGAKAVGKTAMASMRAASVFQLDDPAQREIAGADPDRVLSSRPPVLIDEWQHVPEVWDRVRRAVDAGAEPGRFLMTGSALPEGTGTHSGGGRIVSVRLRPMSLAERLDVSPTVRLSDLLSGARPDVAGHTRLDLEDYTREIIRSGFPGLRRHTGRPLRTLLDGYIDRVVDRDFPELGHSVRNPGRLRRWMTAYAAATSTVTSYEKLRDASTGGEGDKPSRTATLPYRDVLERLYVLDPVPAWSPTRNPIADLAKPPKHQMVDPALACRLLGATTASLLGGDSSGPAVPRDGTLLGAMFESLMTQSVRVYAQATEATVNHLRTHRGAREIDLIVKRADGRVVAIEVKLGRTPSDNSLRHLRWLQSEIGDDLLDAVAITTGREAYRRPDGIAVVPAALLGP